MDLMTQDLDIMLMVILDWWTADDLKQFSALTGR
jgi:hypothetical protein